MNSVFADMSYFVALLIPRDRLHADAMAFTTTFLGTIVTTEFVLIEVANFFSRPPGRERFLRLVEELYQSSSVELVGASESAVAQGLSLFAARPDQEWSLTDCISFQVMTERGLIDSLTADKHFEQAGFRVLL